MPIKLDDVELAARLPALPPSVPVYSLAAPSLDDRRGAIARLVEHLKLGDVRSADLDQATVMASEGGDVHYFHASGAILARAATTRDGAADELRDWSGLQVSRTGGHRATLDAETSKRVIGQARELLQPIGLLGEHVSSEALQLDQVAQLDARGREIRHGAGAATVKFGSTVDGVPVRGAGGKTLAFAEPSAGDIRITGAFHAWRTPGTATAVKLPSVEEAMSVGVLADPELDLHHAAGHKVRITRLEFVYLALPAFMKQSHLFPAFQVEGEVSEGRRGIAFNFARFHHAAPPSAYAAADLAGPFLATNPDGIRPLPPRKQQKA